MNNSGSDLTARLRALVGKWRKEAQTPALPTAEKDTALWQSGYAVAHGYCAKELSDLLAAALQGSETAPPLDRALNLAKQATNGWACYAKRKIEHDEIARLHRDIAALDPARFVAADAPSWVPRCGCGRKVMNDGDRCTVCGPETARLPDIVQRVEAARPPNYPQPDRAWLTDSALWHIVKAGSQYDTTCRALAEELLIARDALALRAADAPAPASHEWRPIETADQDTPALLWTPAGALYQRPRGRADDIRVSAPRFWTWATHWQPLPPPPAPDREEE